MRCAHSRRRFCQFLNFANRPAAKRVSQWIVAASQSLTLATYQALSVQIVIATMQREQFQLEPPIVVWTSDNAVLPELFHDLMALY